MTDIKKQVSEFIEESKTKIKGLTSKGKQVAEKWRETVDATSSKGIAKVLDLLSDLSPKELMDKFGSKKFPELLEQIKKSDFARHSEIIRQELLAFLRIPDAQSVERINVQLEKIAKEVATLKTLKNEIKKLQDDIKALKSTSKTTTKKTENGEKEENPTLLDS